MSRERVALLRYLGAEIVRRLAAATRGAVDEAQRLAKTTPGAVLLDQFSNPANPAVHRRTTGVEILG